VAELEIDARPRHGEIVTFRYLAERYQRDVLPTKAPHTQHARRPHREHRPLSYRQTVSASLAIRVRLGQRPRHADTSCYFKLGS